jgi:hypothetical protein
MSKCIIDPRRKVNTMTEPADDGDGMRAASVTPSKGNRMSRATGESGPAGKEGPVCTPTAVDVHPFVTNFGVFTRPTCSDRCAETATVRQN